MYMSVCICLAHITIGIHQTLVVGQMEEVWARLATPKTTPRPSNEPIVRPDLKKWGIYYPGQLPRPDNGANGQNPVRPPYNTHFHPGQHKQRRKIRGKQRNTKKLKRNSTMSQQDTDLVVTAGSTSRSIFVIHEGESDCTSSSDEDGLPSPKPKRKTRTPKTKRAQIVIGKLPARRPLIKRKSLEYFPYPPCTLHKRHRHLLLIHIITSSFVSPFPH